MAIPAWIQFIVLALLAPILLLSGRAAQLLRLPLITGYVLSGIILGPYGLTVLDANALQSLTAVDNGCLAIIAFSAGAELQLGDVKRIKKQVTYITLGICLATWFAVSGVLLGLMSFLPALATLPSKHRAAVASLAGTLMMARSPASMMAVLKETDGRGPYSSLIMAVVIVKDVVVFVCFAINIEMADVVIRKAESGLSLSHLAEPMYAVAVSIALGALYGVCIGRIMATPSRYFNVILRHLPQGLGNRAKGVVRTSILAVLAMSIFWSATYLSAEPLLACVLSGIITINRKGEAASKGIHEELGHTLAELTPIVNMAFFSLAGASLILGRVVATLWVAVLVWVARMAAIYGGSWLGAWLGGTPSEHRLRVWQGMVTQAGVAMGLAKAVAVRFPDWGPDFVFLMMSVIMMNLFAGPPIFRSALMSTGEARALQLPLTFSDIKSPQKSASNGEEGSNLRDYRGDPINDHRNDSLR